MQASFEHLYTLVAPHAAAARTLASFTRDLIGADKTITAKRHANFLAIAKLIETMLRNICILLLPHIEVKPLKPRKPRQTFPEGLHLTPTTGYRINLIANAYGPAPNALPQSVTLTAIDPCARGADRTEAEDMHKTAPVLCYLLDLELALVNPIKTATKLARQMAKRNIQRGQNLITDIARLNTKLLFPEDFSLFISLQVAAETLLQPEPQLLLEYKDSS